MMDLSEILQNYALTALKKAGDLRKQAASIRGDRSLLGGHSEPWNNQVQSQAASHARVVEAKATLWERVAAVATKGFLLYPINQPTFVMSDGYPGMLALAATQDRVLYEYPDAERAFPEVKVSPMGVAPGNK